MDLLFQSILKTMCTPIRKQRVPKEWDTNCWLQWTKHSKWGWLGLVEQEEDMVMTGNNKERIIKIVEVKKMNIMGWNHYYMSYYYTRGIPVKRNTSSVKQVLWYCQAILVMITFNKMVGTIKKAVKSSMATYIGLHIAQGGCSFDESVFFTRFC